MIPLMWGTQICQQVEYNMCFIELGFRFVFKRQETLRYGDRGQKSQEGAVLLEAMQMLER